MMRSFLLRVSRSRFIERQVKRRRFARSAVRKFMPGEELDDALGAGQALANHGMRIVLTRLGENVTSEAEARAVSSHYSAAMDRVAALGLDAEVSVKPTQLGLDLGLDVATENLAPLIRKADELGITVWIDMEDSSYVDGTLALVHDARARSRRVGVCLQAYLHRTPRDLGDLLDPPVRVRLVKGAYREPSDLVIRRKREVDVRFHELAIQMLQAPGYAAAAPPVFGTHDDQLIERLRESAGQYGVDAGQYEFHLLYGIRTDLQDRLSAAGARVGVLISYGEHWFPWYMRRLAERPANLWFVAKQVVGARG